MVSRREFFTKFKSSISKEREVLAVRPPYCWDESLFLSECPECEDKACQTHCEEEIIIIQADKTPTLNFSKSGCTFCDACADACQKGVLDISKNSQEKIWARFIIEPASCLAHNQTICFSCKEPCIDDAILFNGLFNPVIDDDKCTGCGFCISRCPTKAISYEVIQNQREENDGTKGEIS